MNENLNLVEILKDCPSGTKLYSTVSGEVELDYVEDGAEYPINIIAKYGVDRFTSDGRQFIEYDGECLLFPSREQRDWSMFDAPWLKKESDDVIIKNAILNHLKKMWGNCQDEVCGIHIEDAIAWLEKQGEDKKEINNFDVRPGLYKCVHRMFDGTPDGRLLFEIGNVYKCISKNDRAEFEVSYGHSVYLEDTVVRKYFIPFEKKFNVGDWIITPNNRVLQITSIQGTTYTFNNVSHYWGICDCDQQCRHWTIEDAKDGDILIYDNSIFIYNAIYEKHLIYYGIYEHNKFHDDKYYSFIDLSTIDVNDIHPATKEQQDILFSKMKEEGYEWDYKKKELRRIK